LLDVQARDVSKMRQARLGRLRSPHRTGPRRRSAGRSVSGSRRGNPAGTAARWIATATVVAEPPARNL